jgi:hypothetical protein
MGRSNGAISAQTAHEGRAISAQTVPTKAGQSLLRLLPTKAGRHGADHPCGAFLQAANFDLYSVPPYLDLTGRK